MTRYGSDAVYQSRTTHHVIARKERSERTRQSTVCNGRVRTMRFASLLTVDRHGLRPRDDKSG
jgi:hypothetical protein